MQLPIATHTGDDIIRAARRCRMDLSRMIADEFSADGVFAFSSETLPNLAPANCVELLAELSEGQFERIAAEFTSRNAKAIRWTSPDAEPELVSRGATLHELSVMRLTHWARAAENEQQLMIMQARSAMTKIEALFAQRFGDNAAAVDAILQQVDDPQDEWLIALDGGRAVAAGAMLVSGDTGMPHDLYSIERGGIAERGVLDRAIEFAGRAGLKHVVTCIDAADQPFYQSAGFSLAGRLVEHYFA